MVGRQQHHQGIFGDHMLLQAGSVDRIADDAGLGLARIDRTHDLGAGALQQFHMQAWPFGQPRREPRGQVVGQRGGVGIQVQGAARTLRERLFATQLCLLLQDQVCVVGEAAPASVRLTPRGCRCNSAVPASIVRRRSLAEPNARFACAAPR